MNVIVCRFKKHERSYACTLTCIGRWMNGYVFTCTIERYGCPHATVLLLSPVICVGSGRRIPAVSYGNAAADSNNDGLVTKKEYIENRIITDEAKEIFVSLDANNNGILSKREFLDSGRIKDRSLAERVFEAFDRDGVEEVSLPRYLQVWGRWARIQQ